MTRSGADPSPLPFPTGFTCAGGTSLVPGGFSIPSHDAGEGGAPLDVVAPVAVEGDGGAQLQVRAHPGAVLDGARVKAGLPGVLCRERIPGIFTAPPLFWSVKREVF